ncbi:hypothetical protein TSMEX_001898 [Taenia solium]|eukprot:TsM_001188500 transcript=TsM_001188500 gene=TsM_001188500
MLADPDCYYHASLVQITASVGACLPESMVRVCMTNCTGYVASMVSVGEDSAVWQLVRRGVFFDTDSETGGSLCPYTEPMWDHIYIDPELTMAAAICCGLDGYEGFSILRKGKMPSKECCNNTSDTCKAL